MSKQIGTDDKPFTFRKSIYGKSDGGKGARPRPGVYTCLLYTSPSPRDGLLSRMPSSA